MRESDAYFLSIHLYFLRTERNESPAFKYFLSQRKRFSLLKGSEFQAHPHNSRFIKFVV